MNIKKTILGALLLLTAFINTAMAQETDISTLDNAIYIENFEAGIGKQVVISIKMKNSGLIRGYQCELYLPSGMTFATDNSGNPIARLSGDRTTTEYHSLLKSLQDDGSLRLLCSASEEHYFSGNDGEVAQVTANVSNDIEAGDYIVTMRNIKMGATSNPEEGNNINEIKSTVTVVVQAYDVLLDENSLTVPDASNGNVSVKVLRTINANNWSTICLPFDMTEEQVKSAFGDDVQLGDFTGYDTTKEGDEVVSITVNFDVVTAIEANHPYIIKVTSNISEFAVEDVDIVPEENPSVSHGYTTGSGKNKVYRPVDFNGTYVADFDFYNAAISYPLFLNGNKFYYATENTKRMKAFRAYFDFADYLAEVEDASSRISMSFDNSTDIRGITNEELRMTNEVYDIQGRRFSEFGIRNSELKKGLYIVNGKKVIK